MSKVINIRTKQVLDVPDAVIENPTLLVFPVVAVDERGLPHLMVDMVKSHDVLVCWKRHEAYRIQG